MEGGITEDDRMTMLRAAVAKVGRDELKSALARSSEARPQTPKAVGNALNALGKHRDPVGVVDKPQYRAALPFLAALISDACLTRTIEALGDHSDDPTRAQLEEALDEVRDSFSDVTIGVMLASVASSGMPASDLCFDVAATDGRFGLAGWAEFGTAVLTPTPGSRGKSAVTPEQREARRLKKQKDADERRKKMEVARKAGEQVRRAKKVERSQTALPLRCSSRRVRGAGEQRGSSVDPARRADPGPGGGVRSERPLGHRSGFRLGAVQFRRPVPTRPRGEVAAMRGGGGVPDPPPGSSRLLRGWGQEPRLEVGAAAPLEAGRLRAAHLDRRRLVAGPTGRRWSGGLALSRGLERPLVASDRSEIRTTANAAD